MSKVQQVPAPQQQSPAAEEGASAQGSMKPPDPEVRSDRPKRRRFDADYKRRILEQYDAAKGHPGQVGALLRREGIYSSHITEWKRQRAAGVVAALAPRKRGRKTVVVDAMAERVAELEREKARLEERLRKAEIIIEVQKKISQLLGIPTPSEDSDGLD